jgi:phosphatidyl-myo-inositol alpha-mannosyltransferase
MRIALVSPYSWNYQGGVNRHVEALAEQFIPRGDHVRVLAPWDPPDLVSRRLHRSQPELREAPDYLVPLGRTLGVGANGAVSNLSVFPEGPVALRNELRAGNYDVIHVHEPLAPLVGWDATTFRGAPVVGTFHAYSTKAFPNRVATLLGARRRFNQLSARIAVSEAAAWTGRRWFGGEYEIVPNGVDLEAAPQGPKPASDELRLLFVGRAEERKGLPVLLAAFQALVEHVPSRLTVVGADPAEISRRVADPELMSHIDVLGKVSDSVLWRQLGEADILCAPSLAGESFGMVLIEAMAAGVPVVAPASGGPVEIVEHGQTGFLYPAGDAAAAAAHVLALLRDPELADRMGRAAAEHARERYSIERQVAANRRLLAGLAN